MKLPEEIVFAAANAEQSRQFSGVLPGHHGRAEYHHIHRDATDNSQQGVLTAEDQFSLLLRYQGHIANLSHFTPNEDYVLLQHAVVEFLITLPRGPNVNVKLIHPGGSLLFYQVGEFQGIHTADPGAVGFVVLIP